MMSAHGTALICVLLATLLATLAGAVASTANGREQPRAIAAPQPAVPAAAQPDTLPRLRPATSGPVPRQAAPAPPPPEPQRPMNWRERRKAEPGGYHETSLAATGLVAAMTALLGIFTSGLAGLPRMN